jgi:hypothetical protein
MQENEGRIRVFGPEPESHRIPADVLAQAIKGLQESALVLGAAREGLQLSERFRASNELRQKYTVEVGPPEAGSVAVAFELVDRRAQPALDVEGAAVAIVGMLHDAIQMVSGEAYDELRGLLPDSRWRDRFLKELQSFLPRPGDSWHFGIATVGRAETIVAGRAASQLSKAIGARVESTSDMAVVGTLVRINFESNQLWVKHPVTKKDIECNYLPEVEAELIDARRDYVQVIGEFTLDDAGFPMRLSNVSSVSALNLSPINVDGVQSETVSLRIQPPLSLFPRLDEESMQVLEIIDEELNLQAYGYTRDELISEIDACLLYLWDSFVREDPNLLSEDAAELRARLLARISEVK